VYDTLVSRSKCPSFSITFPTLRSDAETVPIQRTKEGGVHGLYVVHGVRVVHISTGRAHLDMSLDTFVRGTVGCGMSALARRRSEAAIENDERNLNFSVVVMLSLISLRLLLDSIM